MPSINKSPQAERDLTDIWLHTLENWGEEQADRYLRSINKAMERLATKPSSGTDFGHIRPGYRRLPVAHHRVFFYVAADVIEIMRILHERMDAQGQLSDYGDDHSTQSRPISR